MLQTQPSIIIVFGEMASGKSTVAKELAYQYFHLPEDAFFEGDDVLNLPCLSDLKNKVKNNEPLNHDDINKLVENLIDQIKKKSHGNSSLIVAQALYFDSDRRKIQDALGKENVRFIWVKTPVFKRLTQLFNREYQQYLNDKLYSLKNRFYAIWNGIKSIRTNLIYTLYFEKPAEFFDMYSSWMNYIKGIKSLDPVPAIVIENTGSVSDLLNSFQSLSASSENSSVNTLTSSPETLSVSQSPVPIIKNISNINLSSLSTSGLFKDTSLERVEDNKIEKYSTHSITKSIL